MEELFTNANYYNNIRIYPLKPTDIQELHKLDVFDLTLETKQWKNNSGDDGDGDGNRDRDGDGNRDRDGDGDSNSNKEDMYDNIFWQSTYETEHERELYEELETLKDQIEPFHINDLWNDIKKRYNPFEYVYSPTPNLNMCVSKYHPISRSFFKLWEILHDFGIEKNNQHNAWIVANLAEGPGGFMDCITNYRRNPNDQLYGITLPAEKEEIPSWTKIENKRKKYRNWGTYHIDYGNIYQLATIQRYRRNFATYKADFVTADGGFDYSADFNHQEQQSYRMIFSEFVTSITIQKVGGDFVLKVFDILTGFTQKIIYLLTLYYNQVYIVKPFTSRSANSEKYIYCRGFRGIQERKVREWYQLITQWSYIDQINDENINNRENNREQYVINIRGIVIPGELKEQIIEYNVAYIQEQKKYIQFILHKLQNRQNISNQYNHQQIRNAIWWCEYYQVDISNYYKKYIQLNINREREDIYYTNNADL